MSLRRARIALCSAERSSAPPSHVRSGAASVSLHLKSQPGPVGQLVDSPARKGVAECAEANDLPVAPRISTSPPRGGGITVPVWVRPLLGSFINKCTLNRWKRRVRPATLCDIRVPGLHDRLRLYFRIRLALIRSLAFGR